ncbi:hypothetical protein Ac2012v2_006184 [Leucoagaricus gongylophorus]
MPSFSDMKAKASKMASSGVERAQGFRDRNTSVPMKKTNWDPYSGAPPPPPPPRANPNNKPTVLAPLPPPPSRTGSSIGSGSAGPATLGRTTSIGSTAIPPLPSRGPLAGTPPLPRRTSTLEPPPLPTRRASVSPVSSSPDVSSPPPPPLRSPQPPPSRVPFRTTQPSPPIPNLSTKPVSAPVSSLPTPAPAPAPRRSPIISPKSPTPQLHELRSITEQTEIDWANLTEQDRQVFFSWLDEFFTHLLGVPVGPRQGSGIIHA